jgi:hypothetical protein
MLEALRCDGEGEKHTLGGVSACRAGARLRGSGT